jgi:hypothetical protein
MVFDSERGDAAIGTIVLVASSLVLFFILYVVSNSVISAMPEVMNANPVLSQSAQSTKNTLTTALNLMQTFIMLILPFSLVIFFFKALYPMVGARSHRTPPADYSALQSTNTTEPAPIQQPQQQPQPFEAPQPVELNRYTYTNPFAEPEEPKPDHQYHNRFESILDSEEELEQ